MVRQCVGYDRFEGEHAYRQFVELYRALRLYVNFFQPSMKVQEKHRNGAHVRRRYDTAQTPFARRCASGVLPAEVRVRLDDIFTALDPVRLLAQIGRLQDALWQHAVVGPLWPPTDAPPLAAVPFSVAACGLDASLRSSHLSHTGDTPIMLTKRAYHRHQPQLPRWWRTRVDPFAEVWADVEQWLEVQPERTATSVLAELQHRYPGQFLDVHLRTLQRRVACWRATMITTFDDAWMADEVLGKASLLQPLRATPGPEYSERLAGI